MKTKIGQRENLDREVRGAVDLACVLCNCQSLSRMKVSKGSCSGCQHPVETSISEDTATGEIWTEGPEFCPKCGIRLAAENLASISLSQDQIRQLFGPF